MRTGAGGGAVAARGAVLLPPDALAPSAGGGDLQARRGRKAGAAERQLRRDLARVQREKETLQRRLERAEPSAHVASLVDTRPRPHSQLSGFAKSEDLAFILQQFGTGYKHCPNLVPTDDLLRKYRDDRGWISYEEGYRLLIQGRDASRTIEREAQDGGVVCLVCSEHEPSRCHRRVLAAMFAVDHRDCDIVHLQ